MQRIAVALASIALGCGSTGQDVEPRDAAIPDTAVPDSAGADASATEAATLDAPEAAPLDAKPDDGPDAPDASPLQGVTIYEFSGPSSVPDDGAEPKGTLTAVTSGNETVLYGRTAIGGTNGCGVIFSIHPDGSNYDVLYRFGGADGCDPRHDAMTLNPNDGRLYATTQGVNQTIVNPLVSDTYGNWGQIFSFLPGATIAAPIDSVHTFANPSPKAAPFDGAQQHSSFSIDPTSGVLYGQSAAGGANDVGMLYSIETDGSGFTDLYDFEKSDGDDPHGRIVLMNGVLYGIARQGGSANFGSVYAYALTAPEGGTQFTVLHTFTGGNNDGASSDHGYLTPVTVGGQTVLYGMTQCGGTGGGSDACSKSDGGGDGVIFQIDPTAKPGSGAAFNIVYSFRGKGAGDGAAPYGSLLYDGTYLYGTTSVGGMYDNGTVFRLAPPAFGAEAIPTVLYAFGGDADDGNKPIDNVIKVGNTLYGMTVYGGASTPSPDNLGVSGSGAIFALPLPP